jgi:succinoglycan biosynthesis transport protein ExoP
MTLQADRSPLPDLGPLGQSAERTGSSDLTLRGVIRTIRKRQLLIYICGGGALTLAILVCIFMKPQYLATATVMVDKQGGIDLGSLASMASDLGGGGDAKTDLETNLTLIGGPTIALAVAKQLDLGNVEPYKAKRSLLPWKWNKPLPDASALQTDPEWQEPFLDKFGKNLKIEVQEDTRLITVGATNPDPYEAAKIANTVVSEYAQSYLETHYNSTAKAGVWLGDQLADLRKQVDKSQQDLVDYEHSQGLSGLTLGIGVGMGAGMAGGMGGMGGGGGVSMIGNSQIPDVNKLALINAELTAAESNRIDKEAIYQLTKTNSPDVVMSLSGSPLTAGGTSSVISGGGGLEMLNALRQQKTFLDVGYAQAASIYGSRDPKLQQLQSQLRAVDDQISQEMARINERASLDVQRAQNDENELKKSYSEQENKVDKLNDSATRVDILAGEAISSRELYEGLFTKLQEAKIEAGVKATNINLVDMARVPFKPTRPNWKLYPPIGLLAGILIGIAIAFFMENLDDVITTVDQASELTVLPVLSGIPSFRRDEAKSAPGGPSASRVEPSFLISKPNDPVAESYRQLRTAIEMSGDRDATRTLLITSSLPAEGKSTVSYNIAIAFAQQGKRVLLLDADIRRPSLHRLLRNNLSPGLSDILASGADWRQTIHIHPALDKLSLITAGTASPMPSELLGSPNFDKLLVELRREYDRVLIDSPPFLLVTDAAIISQKVDGTILVVRSGSTSRTALRRTLDGMARGTRHNLGLVLNRINTQSAEYYYSYGYYGSDKYYGEDSAGSKGDA